MGIMRERNRHLDGRLFWVVAASIGMLSLGISPASAGAPTCQGMTATIVGDDDSERIEGTDGDDVIVGRGGGDIITGGEGNDVICGNDGSDAIDGGPGNDSMFGGTGPDFITGVDGNDILRGGPDSDSLNFGDEENGDDQVYGGAGNDDLHAGVGVDQLFAGSGDDFLAEGEVDAPLVDVFAGGVGTDTCFAGAEDDVRACEITSSAAVSTPELLTPINNEAIQQNNPNIGCPFHPTRGFGFQIVFDWTDSVADAGIAGYQVFAEHVGSPVPILDYFVTVSEFTYTPCNTFTNFLDSWRWRVKAVDVSGNESAWTEFGLFTFEPCRIDGLSCNTP